MGTRTRYSLAQNQAREDPGGCPRRLRCARADGRGSAWPNRVAL